VKYRLPPAHEDSPLAAAGCWHTGLLILLLLSCAVTEGVKKFAEPIDKDGCKVDCGRADMRFSRYYYETNTCHCWDADGNEAKLYGLDLEK